MKRILSILLSVALVASMLVSMSATSFARAVSDIDKETADIETTVTSITADEYKTLTGKTLPSGKFPMVIETIVTPLEDYQLNVRYGVDESGEEGYLGRVITAMSIMYAFDSNVVYVKNPSPGCCAYIEEAPVPLVTSLGTKTTSKIGFAVLATSMEEMFPYSEITDPDNYDWENGVLYEDLTTKICIAATTDTFVMDVEEVVGLSKLSLDGIGTVEEPMPTYTEKIYVKAGVQVTEDEYYGSSETTYNITFVVDGQEDVVVEVAENELPEYPNGTPSKDGYTFEGWDKTIVEATEDATYTAVFKEIEIPAADVVTMGTPVYVTTNVLPGNADVVTTNPFGEEVTVKLAETLRVHTTFDYAPTEDNELKEMGMLFVPKAVVEEAGLSTDEEIRGIAKDACCDVTTRITSGAGTNIVFKAGLLGIPVKGIDIYAIPYYTLSDGVRMYQTMQTISFE
ncbi:MAG: InlB B-repeat-containing protein [Clostridia bacterium]|nr:InlB B-repeat-containing protein [Clostridia bacterium]